MTTLAPLWVFSMGFVTGRTVGLPRELCRFHARINAIPAAIGCFLFGWWGVPWGILWTPEAIIDNLVHGGGSPDGLDDDVALRRRAGWRWIVPPLAGILGLVVFPLTAVRAASLLTSLPH